MAGSGVKCLESLDECGQGQDPLHPYEALCNPNPPPLTLQQQLPLEMLLLHWQLLALYSGSTPLCPVLFHLEVVGACKEELG